MRIAIVQFFIAALSVAAVLFPFTCSSELRSGFSFPRNIREVYSENVPQQDLFDNFDDDNSDTKRNQMTPNQISPSLIHKSDRTDRWLTPKENRQLLKKEGGEEGKPVQCCPSVLEMVEPVGGTNHDNLFVELYRNGANIQRFYELACKPGIEGKPCRFMDKRYHNISTCVQMYSYTYAIVRDTEDTKYRHHHHHFSTLHHKPTFAFATNSQNSQDLWSMDYIKVRSGCSCQINTKKFQKLSKNNIQLQHQQQIQHNKNNLDSNIPKNNKHKVKSNSL